MMASEEIKKSKKIPKNINNMSKENLQKTLIFKKECNARALLIVERLIEPNVMEEFLLASLKYITDSHYQDVVEERVILKVCGYPLCNENLKAIPKKQFHICTRSNKVFDITERKNFCSNNCYKASQYLKEQTLSSPLWLRDKEVIPQFKLFRKEMLKKNLDPGLEIDLGQHDKGKLKEEIKIITKDDKEKLKEEIKIITKDDKGKLKEEIKIITKDDKEKLKEEIKIITKDDKESSKKSEDSSIVENDKKPNIPIDINEESNENKEKIKTENNLLGNVVEKNYDLENVKLPDKIKKNVLDKEKSSLNYSCVVRSIEKALEEWFTLESLCYLIGDDKVKQILYEKKYEIKNFYEIINKATKWTSKYNERYLALCKRLDILELNEDNDETEEGSSTSYATKPLPDYRALKEEGLQLHLKVKSFYKGKTVYSITDAEKDNMNIPEEEKEDESNTLNLPLVDVYAQRTHRKKIVLDRLNRIMNDLMSTYRLRAVNYCSLLNGLVGTFNLGANNITFKPPEWNFVGLIILKMLSYKDAKIKHVLNLESSRQKTTLLLMGFNQTEGYLERLMAWLIDIDRLIKLIET